MTIEDKQLDRSEMLNKLADLCRENKDFVVLVPGTGICEDCGEEHKGISIYSTMPQDDASKHLIRAGQKAIVSVYGPSIRHAMTAHIIEESFRKHGMNGGSENGKPTVH